MPWVSRSDAQYLKLKTTGLSQDLNDGNYREWAVTTQHYAKNSPKSYPPHD
jgi:hypothetical protein